MTEANAAKGLSEALASGVEAAGDAVVRVEAPHSAPGSGVVWSADGVVVTASHGLDADEGVELGLADGSAVPATLVGRDPHTDVAVLRVEKGSFSAPRWSAPDGLKVGHLVLALARPGRSVRAGLGIVSALGPSWRTPGGGKIDRYLQSDLRLAPGFSGGLLLDVDGRALGMTTAGLLRRHSLVIPTATLQRVVGELLDHGRVRRGFLGVSVFPVRLPEHLREQAGQGEGALVFSVQPGSAADQGGLGQGDILLSLDQQPVRQPGDLIGLLDQDRIGAQVAARIVRAGKIQELALTVGARP